MFHVPKYHRTAKPCQVLSMLDIREKPVCLLGLATKGAISWIPDSSGRVREVWGSLATEASLWHAAFWSDGRSRSRTVTSVQSSTARLPTYETLWALERQPHHKNGPVWDSRSNVNTSIDFQKTRSGADLVDLNCRRKGPHMFIS